MDKLFIHPSISDLKLVKLVLKCNLCWMGGHLSIHAVVYPSNIFYQSLIISDTIPLVRLKHDSLT